MLEAAGVTDPGCVRRNNEDCFVIVPSTGLYAVADGMGGAQAGEHASQLAVTALTEVVAAFPQPFTKDHLLQAFAIANDRVMEAAASDAGKEGMGTTLVAAVPNGDDLLVASVGDSRAYTFENGDLKAITSDQSWVNEVGRRLGLDEAILKNHPMRHVLTMAIGVSDQLRVNTYSVPLKPGLMILLSSDGLHGVATEQEIEQILASSATLEEQCHQLVKVARRNGGPDNITAVLLRVA
jgi:PPM family protein phosphatase